MKKFKKKDDNLSPSEGSELSTKDSVRAIMMIRAYRIRGHLNADLDPLQLLKKNMLQNWIQRLTVLVIKI